MKTNKFLLSILILASLGFILAACSTSTEPDITITDTWGRPSPKVATAGAFYMVIQNSGGQEDNLISASSSSCSVIELHETYDKGDGIMGMRQVEGGKINIPARGEVQLKMGGLHLMCINKLDDFIEGAKLGVTLEFEKSGTKTIEVEIKNPDM
jgi:copper(I)-binding protein